ncbi:MAG: hypothetical protein M9941_00780 [Anaerolineae bacterium]|nr:hypothetical protein [Anaerolineae bacterium]
MSIATVQSAEYVLERLPHLGIIALVPGEIPTNQVIAVADALLASPVEAVEIVPNGPNTLDTLDVFRRRAGQNMLVGAGRVETVEQLAAVIDAGAQFASSSADFMLPLMAAAKKRHFLYLPTIHAAAQALLAHRAGSLWQKIRDDVDAESLESIQERLPTEISLIGNQIPLDFIDAALESDLRLVCVNDIYLDAEQPMADIITRARAARQMWLDWMQASAE